MRNISLFFGLAFFIICFNSCAQDRQNCNEALENSITPILRTLHESREVYKTTKVNYSKIIQTKIEILTRKSSAQPEKYGNLKVKSDTLQKVGVDLNVYIDALIEESTPNHFDDLNYAMMSDTILYGNLLFDKDKNLSERGIELKEKIDLFYKTNNGILNAYQNDLRFYNESKFNTDLKFNDYDGNEIDYMNHKLTDKSVIGIVSFLERLQLEIKTFQFLFMNSIIQ